MTPAAHASVWGLPLAEYGLPLAFLRPSSFYTYSHRYLCAIPTWIGFVSRFGLGCSVGEWGLSPCVFSLWLWVLRNPLDPAGVLGGWGNTKHYTTLPGGLGVPSPYPGDGEAIPPVFGELLSMPVRGKSRTSNTNPLLLSFALWIQHFVFFLSSGLSKEPWDAAGALWLWGKEGHSSAGAEGLLSATFFA